MVSGTHPDRGAMDRSPMDRWSNPTCEIGVYLNDTLGSSFGVVNGALSCAMTDTHTLRATVTYSHLSIGSGLITAAEVHRSIAQPYWTATLWLDKTTTGGRTSSIFFSSTPVSLFMTDYSGKVNPVFVGVIPSEQETVNSWAGQETLTAYSYAWYLSKQYLPDIPVTRGYFNNLTNMPYIPYGDAYSTGYDGQNIMYPDTYINALLGRNINYYSSVWSSGEQEGVWYVDDTSSEWERVTNLYPRNILTPTSDVDTSYMPPPWIHQNFSTITTKQQAINRLNTYYQYISYDKWSYDATNSRWQPDFYWIPFVEIDQPGGLSLPAKVNLTCGSATASDLANWLVGDISIDQRGDEKYNCVIVRCQSVADGTWLQHVAIDDDVWHPVYNSGSTGPYVLPIEYYEENPDIGTQADCDARAHDLYTYYQNQVLTYRMTFKMRSDLELYQLVAVSGYTASTYGYIEDGDYRIIEITHRIDYGGQINETEVVLMKDDKFRAYQNLSRVYTNSISEIQNLIKDTIAPGQQKLVGRNMQVAVTGPCMMQVTFDITNPGGTDRHYIKRAWYAGTDTIAAWQKVEVSMGANGVLIAKPI